MNITIDDFSPRLQFFSTAPNGNRTWVRSETADPAVAYCYRNSFTATVGEGDRMVFTFNGSAVWVYGTNWFNHGAFSARIDNKDPVVKTGTSDDRIFQKILHYEGDLDVNKEHTLTLTNLPSASQGKTGTDFYLDIDYIVVQQPIAKRIYTTELDDFSPLIQYSGPPAWDARFPTAPVHHNLTLHATSTAGSTATLQFNGSSVEVFGSLNADNGNYSAIIDGVRKGTFNGTWSELLPDTSLFGVSGLSDGPHTLVLTNIPSGASAGRRNFNIDRIVFNSTVDPSGRGGSAPPSSSSGGQDDSKSTTPIAAIAGGVAGGVVALAIIGGLVWWFLRRKRNMREGGLGKAAQIDLTGDEVKPFRNEGGVSPLEGVYSDEQSSYILVPAATASRDSMGGLDNRNLPRLNIPAPPGSDATSYPPSTVGRSAGPATETPIRPGFYPEQNPFASGASTTSLPYVTTSTLGSTFSPTRSDNLSPSDSRSVYNPNLPPISSRTLSDISAVGIPHADGLPSAVQRTSPTNTSSASSTAYPRDFKSPEAASLVETLRQGVIGETREGVAGDMAGSPGRGRREAEADLLTSSWRYDQLPPPYNSARPESQS